MDRNYVTANIKTTTMHRTTTVVGIEINLTSNLQHRLCAGVTPLLISVNDEGEAVVYCGDFAITLNAIDEISDQEMKDWNERAFRYIISRPEILDDFDHRFGNYRHQRSKRLPISDHDFQVVITWIFTLIQGLKEHIPTPAPLAELGLSSQLKSYLAADGGCQ